MAVIFRGKRSRNGVRIFKAFGAVLLFAVFAGLSFVSLRANAGPSPVGAPPPLGYTDYGYVTPPMDIALLIAAIQGDAAAIDRFNTISDNIQQLVSDPADPNYMQPFETCTVDPSTFVSVCAPVVNAGGQNMINLIVNALQDQLGIAHTAPEQWWAPSAAMPAPQRAPGDVTAVVNLLNQVQANDDAALLTLQAAFVANDFFRPYGYKPYTAQKPPDPWSNVPPPPPVPSGRNVGIEALAFIVGGTGEQALRTIAHAQQGNATAATVLNVLFAFATDCQPDPTEPADAGCLAKKYSSSASSFGGAMATGVSPASALDNTLPKDPGGIILRALPSAPDLSADAQEFTWLAISEYVDRIDDPAIRPWDCGPTDFDCEPYGGPATIAYLQSAMSVLPAVPEPDPITPPTAPGSASATPTLSCIDTGTPPASNLPYAQRCADNETVVGAGLHAVPSPGDNNTATLPCEWETADVVLQETDDSNARFQHDPCWLRDAAGNTVVDSDGNEAPSFTRNTRKLDFAQKFKAGEQWAGYFQKWVQQQWIPALRMMTAQLTAAIIDQTLKIGMAFDAMAVQKTAVMLQKKELESKIGLRPGEQACTSASPMHGIVRAQYYSNMMSSALGTDLQTFAGTGEITGNGAP